MKLKQPVNLPAVPAVGLRWVKLLDIVRIYFLHNDASHSHLILWIKANYILHWAIPEARTKKDAEKAENKIKKGAYDGKYGKFSGIYSFTEFAKKTYLNWAKLNKRWWYIDKLIVETLCLFFDKKTFQEITPSLIEKFKKQRRTSTTRNKKPRAAATVNRELAVLSKILSLAID
jgi:hypothetical protein